MNEEKVQVCWNCFQIFQYQRKTARYCSDKCRVQDNKKRAEEISIGLLKLKLNQKGDRFLKAYRILEEYLDTLNEKNGD